MLPAAVQGDYHNTVRLLAPASSDVATHTLGVSHAPFARVSAAPAEAQAFCESKLSSGDIGLWYSALFSPAPQRSDLTALYAFWLEVREINDECADADVARLKLAWWQDEIQEAVAGRPRHPAAIALAPVIAAHHLPAQHFIDVIRALADHAGAGRYATFEALWEHGERTRGRVEVLAAQIIRNTGPETGAYATALGAALELVALLREAPADACRDRWYLPQDDLTRFGVTINDLRQRRASAGARALVVFEAERLLEALGKIATSAGDMLPPHAVSAAIGLALLRKIRGRAGRVSNKPPQLLPLRQLWIAWRTARKRASA